MAGISAFLHEDEPGLHTVCGCCVDGSLQRSVVSRCVLCHDSVVKTGFGLCAFHHFEGDVAALKGVAGYVGDSSGGHAEGVLAAVCQARILIGDGLAAHCGFHFLPVQRG